MEDKMKKTTSLILMLLFSGVLLLGEAINTTSKAAVAAVPAPQFCCNLLTGCSGGACCPGRGEGVNCLIACADGSGIICPKAEVVVAAE
jgi:hypothetical protein